ncbi:MAG: zinc-binding dehydrogenase [Caldilineaceae bacterium]|nr:zinc-binding dehydrogenase [Caldilineaceae bacterium]
MKTQALICTDNQEFSLEEFDTPAPAPDQILVRNTFSGVSVGTEFAVIRHTLDWGPFPVCTGYQAVGIVETVGHNVTKFKSGDKVYYRRNFMPMQWGAQKVNGCAGTHASHAIIPAAAEVEVLPSGVDDATGALFVMPSVGYNAVNMAGVQMGDVVAFHAVGPIGLGALVAARLRGAITIAIDLNPKRLEMAQALGADHVIHAGEEDVKARVDAITPGGADVVFEGSGVAACLDLAFPLARRLGKFVFLGNYGNAPISFHFLVPHGKQLTAFFPCNDGLAPCRAAVLRNIATGAIPWHKTITHRVAATEAPALYAAINRNAMPDMLGAVIQWD